MHHDTRQPPRRISASDMYPTPYYDEFAREPEDEMLERHLCFLWSQREGAEEDLPGRSIYAREQSRGHARFADGTEYECHRHLNPAFSS